MGAAIPFIASAIIGYSAAQVMAPSINVPQAPPPPNQPPEAKKAATERAQNQRKKQQQQQSGAAGTVKTSPLGVPNIAAGDGKTLLGY